MGNPEWYTAAHKITNILLDEDGETEVFYNGLIIKPKKYFPTTALFFEYQDCYYVGQFKGIEGLKDYRLAVNSFETELDKNFKGFWGWLLKPFVLSPFNHKVRDICNEIGDSNWKNKKSILKKMVDVLETKTENNSNSIFLGMRRVGSKNLYKEINKTVNRLENICTKY